MNEISIKKAVMINFVSKYTNVFLQLIINGVLARLLTPEDFGIAAVINVFTTFFLLFADMGVGTAIVQNKTLTDEDTNNIYSFTFYLATILAILFSLFSVPLSIFYGNQVYLGLGLILSISLFFNTINMVPNAVLLKNKKFMTVGLRSVVVYILSSIITIVLAFYGFKYYAIVINSVIVALFTFIWNLKSVDLKFHIKFDYKSIVKIKNFSTFQFAFSVVNYFSRNLDNLLIGKLMGSIPLGFYDKAYKLMLYPVGNLTHVITPVLHPILSEHQNDKEYIYTQYMNVVKILSLLGVFVTTYCYFMADDIIIIMFGEQWLPSVESFKILSLSIWAQMIMSSSGAIFQSLGNTKLLFVSGGVTASLSVISIIIGISLGKIEFVAMAISTAYNLNFIVTFVILIKYAFNFLFIDFIKRIFPDLIVLLISIIGFYFVSKIEISNFFNNFMIKSILGLSAYLMSLVITRQYVYLYKILLKK